MYTLHQGMHVRKKVRYAALETSLAWASKHWPAAGHEPAHGNRVHFSTCSLPPSTPSPHKLNHNSSHGTLDDRFHLKLY